MTTQDIAELKRLAELATPGPYRECRADKGGCVCGQVWSTSEDALVAIAFRGDDMVPEPKSGRQANAAFMAAANPSMISSFIAELESRDHKIAELEAAATINERYCAEAVQRCAQAVRDRAVGDEIFVANAVEAILELSPLSKEST